MKNFSYFAIITKNGVDHRFFMLDMTAEDVIDFIKDFDLDKLGKCCSIKKLMLQKEWTLIKQVYQKNECLVIIGISKMLDLDLNHMFELNVTIQ